ncbi:hypothetical protein OEZ85_000675 [Tetradesmus obliquus]|uniref:C-CAP/cofactor C-like domain-containing protein n=1 Tax=Tetradesmus obliquus TaxID=3088 RepID=A0ABY8UPC6_TETOB|nr:hypothetical protein OEZ85_000675 [Tetradesmus obliquus]
MSETYNLQPRDVVVGFGLLKVLAPELESVQAVQALHRSLASVATTGNDGNKYVSASAAAAALEIPAEQCQLLLYTLAAVGGKAGAAAAESAGRTAEEGGASIFDLSLFLMAQLYNREAQKHETQDHWPDPSGSSAAQQQDAFKAGGRAVQPGSPGGGNSRMLVKSQIQQQQRQQQAYCRGYSEFLQKHQRVLLELVMNDSSAAEAWQQQRTATIQQHKAGNAAVAGASPITPPGPAAAAAGGAAGTGLGLSSIRLNPINTSSSSSRGLVAVAAGSVGERRVSGVYRGTVVQGPGDVGDEITIDNCIECHIYVLAPVRLARITNCMDCTVCIGAVGTLLRVDSCERLQLTAAAGQVLVVSCHSCCLHLGTPRQPALLGDCRFVKLAPFNTRYETLLEHMAAAGLAPNQPSLWDQPAIIPCSMSSSSGAGSSGGAGSGGGASPAQQLQRQRPGAATPSSPHTHGSSGGGSERRGSSSGLGQKPVLLMSPEEFLPLVVPFRGTAGPLAGGAAHNASTQWLPGIHKQQAGPLPPLPFPLPDAFDAALQQQYAVVTELRSRIRGSGLDEGRRNQLQGCIQSFFREWLHSSGAIRQVYDLSKLEGDEYGPAGGSPPAAFRDHSQL